MISEQNMGYGVSDLDVVGLFEKICRARVMEVWVDFGGHCILIGYPFPNAHEMHKNQELIHIRGWLSLFLDRNIFSSSSFLPFRSPTMAGGLLAAHREYFFEIGGYGK